MATIEEIRAISIPACNKFRVKRLELFGSPASGVASTDSDVDLLVAFEEPSNHVGEEFRFAPLCRGYLGM